ncbi:MAG: response regulator [Nitrospirae bacterium CG_4_9_14_3_um_filter_53_35]|nr:MAG: response regulator [Nitrospirae bacterium CG2_30_53_67]PIV84634.1 MAG: response regulator [Nitrospirae bacterium CG17_big_fil_post_rev_8_21_14_2_50_50_9]PIW85863.1 MAG: response regulator [Nitrospirae bacterium CG_4_8_14_3_um_filter_50_41]PIX84956.1 MAG: response regulator [Nitrospirae bacterium CG_4_10_14_3_um_filter_53_41]PJA77368.1 MAG: response regulator [Nitrospirae bacterium CG_4_9_14_3_um_filter_53_35]
MKDIKVLLVDDEEAFVNTLAQRLKMRDLKVETVYNGEEALSYVKEKEPDVMVLDLKMPGLHGMDVLRKIRKAYPNIQVIVLTGHGTEKDEIEAKRLGGFDFLKKPADIETLVSKIRVAYKEKLERAMTAVAFAESGEFDTAREIMNEEEND